MEPDRLSLVLRSLSWSNGASSEVGVLGGVRVEAKTSNWRERYEREFMCDRPTPRRAA